MPNSIEYYTARGFDIKSATYFASGRRTIIDVVPCNDYSLILTFDNGEKRRYDCKLFISVGTVFEFLIEYEDFKRVYLDVQHCVSWDKDPSIDSSKVWSNKVDLCSDACYIDSVPIEVTSND